MNRQASNCPHGFACWEDDRGRAAPGRGHHQRYRGRGRGRGRVPHDKEDTYIPDELIDPCKVFVSNLRPQVTEAMLWEALSHYATLEKVTIIKDKHTKRSKGYGFVKVKTQDDVDRLLGLRDADRYVQGRAIVIKLAKKKVSLPGDDGYVRRPLPDREFDLTQPDPTQASIHMLVDDVMFKIFNYLPIKNVVLCEGVCRRWQMLLHRHFSQMTSLEINESSLDIAPPFTKGIVSKLLILSGPNLRSLKVQRTDFATKQNILKIISQLCPVLESLDVTKARGINFVHITKLAAGCKNIKSFIAKNCTDFDEKALHQLLVSYPRLERLNVTGTSVYGKNFNLLPNTMKELCLERIPDLCHKKRKITEIADRCPNIEILEMKECVMSKSDLEYFGKHCHRLTKLSVYISSKDATTAFASFTNLKDLTLVCDTGDIRALFNGVPKLESLFLETREMVNEEADFSMLKKLKVLKLNCMMPPKSSLVTLTKCEELEELHLFKCHTASPDIVLSILKSCRKMKRVAYTNIQVTSSFITGVDEIMRTRSGKLVIEVQDSGSQLRDAQYDKNKIQFENTYDLPYLFDPFEYDSDDSDYSDSSFNNSWYGFDSDGDFPDHYLFNDDFHGDFLDAAVMLAAWNMQDSDFVWNV